MPTYELICDDCSERFELFVMRIIRDEDKTCPACGSRDVSTGVGGGVIGRSTDTSVSCGPVGGFG